MQFENRLLAILFDSAVWIAACCTRSARRVFAYWRRAILALSVAVVIVCCAHLVTKQRAILQCLADAAVLVLVGFFVDTVLAFSVAGLVATVADIDNLHKNKTVIIFFFFLSVASGLAVVFR